MSTRYKRDEINTNKRVTVLPSVHDAAHAFDPFSLPSRDLIVGEAARVAARALALLERVARLARALGRRSVGVVRETTRVAASALALLERVARRRAARGGAIVTAAAAAAFGVRETTRVAASAFAFLERVAHGSTTTTAAAVGAAAAAAAAFRVRETTRVAASALAFLERVAHGTGAGTFTETRLLGVLAFRASRGLILPALGLVKLLFPRGEGELAVAVAAVQSDVLVFFRKAHGVGGGLGGYFEVILLFVASGGILEWCGSIGIRVSR